MNTYKFGAPITGVITHNFTPVNWVVHYVLTQLRQKGKIVYEYNPFRNLRNTEGELIDFDTDKLNFSLNNPVVITCQPSYDGSVNLILNDNLNPPRLINSRFTVHENNTYEIVDRIGNNDTNIYDDNDQFPTDTSLYKKVTTLLNVDFNGLGYGGNLKVGNYVFYFKYCDADGNETDFVEESGIVTCHVGNINDPFSIRGGISDENSYKTVSFTFQNLDPNYEYMLIYYTRSTSGEDGIEQTTAFKIDKKFPLNNKIATLTITGNEPVQQITVEDINVQYTIVDRVRTQDACQNMLFLGNINKPTIPYEELTDISLRIYPSYVVDDAGQEIGILSDLYDNTNGVGYYDARNIYNKLGYWNEEIYRFGIVYILSDNTLTPVFDIRGRDEIPMNLKSDSYTDFPYTENGLRKYISIDESTYLVDNNTSTLENTKGVCRFYHKPNSHDILGIKFNFQTNNLQGVVLKDKLLELGVKGYFFVRQKRIPTILAQALTLGLDNNSGIPMLPIGNKQFLAESFINSNGVLTHNFNERIYKVEESFTTVGAAICPEFEQRQPFFNNLFTGTEFVTKVAPITTTSDSLQKVPSEERLYTPINYGASSDDNFRKANISGLADNMALLNDNYSKFRGRGGEAEEAWKFSFVEREEDINYKKNKKNNIIRGSFGPFLGLSKYNGSVNTIINIYVPGYNRSNFLSYFNTRFTSDDPYFSIGKRLSLEEVEGTVLGTFYRGDCFLCNYTHRMNRNFQDPEAPTNDEIVDANTWKDNYTKGDSEKNGKINRGDVNAIQLGHWVSFKVYSNINLNLRNTDTRFVTEEGLTGQPRGFYPLQSMSINGESKIPESTIINGGISSTTSDRYNYILPDVPYIKNNYQTRIIYSDIAVNDAFRNGFRVFQLTHYRDYPKTYGGLMKLVELFGNLLCVFEHGVALIPVNERLVAGEGSGGNAFINTSNVLPENPKMLSDMFGSQWAESVIKTPYFVYGVDTVGKKIWRTNGSQFEIISDFKIQSFLNDNISLTERELTPIIGVRNVKTHYNAYKGDVMFTFYDNLYGFEEKVWNICYNEVLQKWVTFYSWVPSYSENIDNIFFSFNRNTSKWITKLGMTSKDSTNADGIVLDNVIFDNPSDEATISIVNRALPTTQDNVEFDIDYVYSIEKGNFGDEKYFVIEGNKLKVAKEVDNKPVTAEILRSKAVWQLNIKVDINLKMPPGADTNIQQYVNGWKDYTEVNYGYYQSTVAVTNTQALNNNFSEEGSKEKPSLTTAFWKHGKAGIIDIQDKILPTKWYGDQHPFEFEFVVAVNPTTQKLFNNLQVISNKAAPESFHYEIVGECYSFSNDKPNMYYRQEATKELYQNLGSDILFNRNYTDIEAKRNPKSTIFPLYYARQDTFNEIEDKYVQMTDPTHSRDYRNLSGSEIVYDERLQEFRILTHIKGSDFDKVGRLRGNMNYQEDKWLVQIPSLTFMQKNETWEKTPPLVLNWLPDDLTKTEVTAEDLPNTFDMGMLDVSKWTYRQEARLRDKYLKVKIRYTGEEKAIIVAIKTLFTLSYA